MRTARDRSPKACVCWQGVVWTEARGGGPEWTDGGVVWCRSWEVGRTRTAENNPLFINRHMPGRPVASFDLTSSSH